MSKSKFSQFGRTRGDKNQIFCTLAMTGMISSTGKIGPVGAISEKVMAAFKAGLTNVIIPETNRTDFELLPSRIKDNLKIHYAKTYEDIYKLAFESHL